MRYETLKNAIQEAKARLTDECCDILDNVLDRFDEDDKSIDLDDIYDAISDEVDNFFIYYDDAWSYLENNSITDFDDAIYAGCTSVCSIAYYYAKEEIDNELDLWEAENSEEEDE